MDKFSISELKVVTKVISLSNQTLCSLFSAIKSLSLSVVDHLIRFNKFNIFTLKRPICLTGYDHSLLQML